MGSMNLDAHPLPASKSQIGLIYAVRILAPHPSFNNPVRDNEVFGFITAVGVAEFCHRRKLQEAQSRGFYLQRPWAATLHWSKSLQSIPL